jgi:hypothetical protein
MRGWIISFNNFNSTQINPQIDNSQQFQRCGETSTLTKSQIINSSSSRESLYKIGNQNIQKAQ